MEKQIVMKKQLVTISFAAFLFALACFALSQQSLADHTHEVSIGHAADVMQTGQQSLATDKVSVGHADDVSEASSVVCTQWTKIGTDSRCIGYHDGMCICEEYWDVERRACGIPGTSWGWYEHQNTNYRTAGC